MLNLLRKLSFQFWLIRRHLRHGGKFVNLTTFFAFIGMVLGVACLVISMAVISGFETTLKSAVIGVSGHVMLMKAGGSLDPLEELLPQVRKIVPTMEAYTPFVQSEAMIAHQGRTGGVVVQGVDPTTVKNVLQLEQRVVAGKMDLTSLSEHPHALVGKALAKKYKLNLGDVIQVVAPRPSTESVNAFSPKSMKLKVVGFMDLGKYDYDLRFILTTAEAAKELRGAGSGYSGLKIRLKEDRDAQAVSQKLSSELGYPYWARDWVDINRNLFEAIQLEKAVIFIVLLFMVLTACFNICSTLFVNVLKRYVDVSILQTMGASPRFIMVLFSLHGLVIGLLGSLTGVGFGVLAAHLLARSSLFLIPAEIYKLDHLDVDFRLLDLLAIIGASMLICLFSTIAPAYRGSKLKPVDGLRYE
ncbi:MAG: ABC transporter permease [Bdellovibrionales bacterium]